MSTTIAQIAGRIDAAIKTPKLIPLMRRSVTGARGSGGVR